MKILAVSDQESGLIYSPQIKTRFSDVDMVISCGDLHYYYLEYIISMLDRPLYYVRGNHASRVEHGVSGERSAPWGGYDMHHRFRRTESGLLLAGVEGSVQYNYGPYQYSQFEMWMMIWGMLPRLLFNKIRYGRYLDIFITHAPPWKIHDKEDLPHQGIKAFRWLDEVFQPLYHLHGHIHVYRQDETTMTRINRTLIVNTYGYKELFIDPDSLAVHPIKR